MSFTASIRSVYGKYATFRGRASRSEYWWHVLFSVLVVVGLLLVARLLTGVTRDPAIAAVPRLAIVFFVIFSIIPNTAVAVRRLHDSDRSGWWYLIGFVPLLGELILFVLFILPGTKGDNRFGPAPDRRSPSMRTRPENAIGARREIGHAG